ncbi:MAG: metallophosphoesterase family protein [Spongiibacter marinus]|uniref:metallophosphoesterase family protein n=1 Tax=Spongiibacter marinus TaxID=354246 RepID=UPI003C5AC67F
MTFSISRRLLGGLLFASALTACNSDSDSSSGANSSPVRTEPFSIGLLPDTQGGSDAQGQAHVAMYPMREVLKHQSAKGVDLVIAVGDLTDKGSTVEWDEWTSVAEDFRDGGIEFLPVMGNHEMNYAYTTEWIANMRNYIPEDAVHMPGYEWVNYYVVRSNVLIIGLAYYNLPLAIDWIKDVVAENADVEHIVVASHDGLIGAKYGQTREQIVEGTKGDDWVYGVQKDIREFFAEHDVIYVQGHEHQYQRSLISATTMQTTFPASSTPSGGNYQMGVYTQIMAGNASYKGYEFRYGERELVQAIVSQKNATYSESKGSDHFDVNSSILRFDGDRVDYQSYYAEHQARSNDSSQDFDAQWVLMDQFSRAKNRCETVVYPNSIPDGTRSVLVFQTEYITDTCLADDGSSARLVGGDNDTFNRTDTRTRDMEYVPGFSRAESLMDLTRLAYQWLYQYHESWTPNLNNRYRAVPDEAENVLLIPETTIDLKEHVTLSWQGKTADTLTDRLLISGMQNQTGVYQGAYGGERDIAADTGLPLSQPDGTAKAPAVLPGSATQSWDISTAKADPYAVAFTVNESVPFASSILAQKTAQGWQAIATPECVVESAWQEGFIGAMPNRAAACESQPLLGYDANARQWWAVLGADTEIAVIRR